MSDTDSDDPMDTMVDGVDMNDVTEDGADNKPNAESDDLIETTEDDVNMTDAIDGGDASNPIVSDIR
jgi:hypothetical protein